MASRNSSTNFAASFMWTRRFPSAWARNISRTNLRAPTSPGATPIALRGLHSLFSTYLEKRLGPTRQPDQPLEQRHHNLAASMQAALEEVLAAHWSALAEKTGEKSLCLAGGVAFNCVANGKIRSPFERVYVQPAAGDAGLSVGAAFAVNHQVLGRPREFVMDHAGWGPQFSPQQIREAVDKFATSGDDVQIASNTSMKPHCSAPPRTTSPKAKSSAGFKAASNGARAPSANAAFSPTRAAPK